MAGTFHPPVNFEQRNGTLVQGVSRALQKQKRAGGLGKFRQLSSQFRQGTIEATEYYEQCREAMGSQTFSELFPELLALLPDIRKQQVSIVVPNYKYPNFGINSCLVSCLFSAQ